MQEMQEMWVRSLGWEDALQEGMATPLQYSYLENPMDRGTWQAIVHGVTQRGTLSSWTHTHTILIPVTYDDKIELYLFTCLIRGLFHTESIWKLVRVYSITIWSEHFYWNWWYYPHFAEEVTKSQTHEPVRNSSIVNRKTLLMLVMVGRLLFFFFSPSKRLRRGRWPLFRVVGKQLRLEALSPGIPESTTGRTQRSCRKCVLRINGGVTCWARTFSFPHLHLGDLYFSFLEINVLYFFFFFFSEGTSVKPMAVELSDSSLPRN